MTAAEWDLSDLPTGTVGGRDPFARVIRLSDVLPERLEWLWAGRIPLGKITVIDGDPGLGKSTVTIDLAARVSTGSRMPDGSPGRAPAGVILMNAEDGVADTVRPRLEAAGGDLGRVAVLTISEEGYDRPALVPDDLVELEAAIIEMGAAMAVIDPLMAHLPGSVNSYRDQDVRRALAPLAAMAERTSCAIVVIRHLTKGGAGGNSLYRGGGSIAFIGAARAGLLVAADPDDDSGERRILAGTKENLSRLAPAMSFTLESTTIGDGIPTSRVLWGEATDHTAAQLLAVQVLEHEDHGPRDEARDVLLSILANGPVGAKEARAEARLAGIADRTLDRARAAMGVIATRTGGLGAAGRWEWSLPANNAAISLSAPVSGSDVLTEIVAPIALPVRLCPSCRKPHPVLTTCPDRA